MVDGKALKQMRLEAGIGVRELSRRLGFSHSYLSFVEHNSPKHKPTEEIVAGYAKETGAEKDLLIRKFGFLPSTMKDFILKTENLFNFLCLALRMEKQLPTSYWEKLTEDLKGMQKEPIKK